MLPINSDRQKLQLYIEQQIGCHDPLLLPKYKNDFDAFCVTYNNENDVIECILEDSSNIFEKGVISFIEGILGIQSGRESWSLVKLYYSIYYLLRCELLMNGIGIVRCKEIYTIRAIAGHKPVKWKKDGTDHKATIGIYKNEFKYSDVLLSQNIDGVDSYLWYSSMREWINYRISRFPELENKSLVFPVSAISFEDQIRLYISDNTPYFCFDSEYAILALPVKRMQYTVRSYVENGYKVRRQFSSYVKTIAKGNPTLTVFVESLF